MTQSLNAKWNAIRLSKDTPPLVVFTDIQFNRKPENQKAYEQLFTEYKATLPENASHIYALRLGKLLLIYYNEETGMKDYMGGRENKQKLFVEVTEAQHAQFTVPQQQHPGLDIEKIKSFLEMTLPQCAALRSILLDQAGKLIPYLDSRKRKSQGFNVHFQPQNPDHQQNIEVMNALFPKFKHRTRTLHINCFFSIRSLKMRNIAIRYNKNQVPMQLLV